MTESASCRGANASPNPSSGGSSKILQTQGRPGLDEGGRPPLHHQQRLDRRRLRQGGARLAARLRRDGRSRISRPRPRHPVNILELGCGSGRFGYPSSTGCSISSSRSSLRQVQVRYVMTDFTESTLEPLRRHELLQPWIEAGDPRLRALRHIRGRGDPARWLRRGARARDAAQSAGGDRQLRLRRHPPGRLRGARRPALRAAGHPDRFRPRRAPAMPTILQRVAVSWEERPATPEPYGDPELDAILREYAERLRTRRCSSPRRDPLPAPSDTARGRPAPAPLGGQGVLPRGADRRPRRARGDRPRQLLDDGGFPRPGAMDRPPGG